MRRTTLCSLAVALAALMTMASCTISKTEPPPLTGPSELGLSLQMTANPSVLQQDGASQSLIRITARGPNGQPARSVALRAEITLGGTIVDFGRLSARTLVTDNNGEASLVYTAPPFVGEPVDTGTVVTILVTPAETDNRNAVARQLDIRLIPPGVLTGPNTPPTAAFSFSPANPLAFQNVNFDASASADPDGVIVNYAWDFGDGSSGSGRVAQHEYRLQGIYNVRVTVTDNRGASATSPVQGVTVGSSAAPTASFTFSPTSPAVNQDIVFNAAASTPAPGRTIARYDWNFGSGSAQQGQVVTKAYDVAGTYAVTLTVTDDTGARSTAQQSVNVTASTSPTNPVASFTFSPTNPVVGQQVTFNATASSSPAGIVSYRWNFGDTSPEVVTSNPVVTHIFATAQSYVVSLVVTDGAGRLGSTTNTVSVGSSTPPTPPAAPTASFVFSPSSPAVNQPVVFNASASRAATGRTIVRYDWNFGNGTTFSSAQPTATNTYNVPATYNVTLVVTDDAGNSSSTFTSQVTVTPTSQGTPQPTFTFSPANPVVGTSVNFNASSSTAPGSTIVSWVWDFGDGTPGIGQTTSHVFNAAFTYVVRLTVTDSAGRTGATTQTVTVTLPAGPTASLAPIVKLGGLNVRAVATANSPSGLPLTYRFSWGDGSGDTGPQAGASADHLYGLAGTFTITLTVRDTNGQTATATQTVTVP